MSETRKLFESFQNNLKEDKSQSLIKSYNETDYGYHNNATTIYGELIDGNWYVFIPDNDYLEIFNSPIDQKYLDSSYNYQTDDEKADDAWLDKFNTEHKIDYDKDLYIKLENELNNRYFKNEDIVESVQNNLKENDEDIYCGTLEEFKKEVIVYGGLYGFVAEKYYSMPTTLLKEIALNAIYELNNDEKVINDVAERLYNDEK